MRKLLTTGLSLAALLASAAAFAEPPGGAPGPRALAAPRAPALLGYYPGGYAAPVPMCAGGGERVVSSESHFYSFPLFIAGLGGIALAPVVGASVGVPLEHAFPSSDSGVIAGVSAGVAVLAAGITLAVVGGHRVTREVHAISALVQPMPGGLGVRF
jgi:hypothetical protein